MAGAQHLLPVSGQLNLKWALSGIFSISLKNQNTNICVTGNLKMVAHLYLRLLYKCSETINKCLRLWIDRWPAGCGSMSKIKRRHPEIPKVTRAMLTHTENHSIAGSPLKMIGSAPTVPENDSKSSENFRR